MKEQEIIKASAEPEYIASVNIFKPFQLTIEGELDNQKYKLEISEWDLPKGAAPEPPPNVQVLEWDESFYVTWDKPKGPVGEYQVEMLDSADNVAAEVTEIPSSQRYYKFYHADRADANEFITNGEQYAFKVKAKFRDVTNVAPEVLGTASNKVPQNITKDSQTEDSITISWNTVAGRVAGYDLVMEDVVNSEEVERNFVQSSPGILPILDVGLFDIYVQAVSDLKIFRSDKSTVIQIYISEEITDLSALFDNTVDEINVSWSAIDIVDSYDVYFREQGGSFSLLENTTSTNRTYDAFNFGNGVYEFKVIPIKSGLEGKESNIDSADVNIPVVIVTEDDMNETQSNIVYDGSDIVVKITEADMNESNSTT